MLRRASDEAIRTAAKLAIDAGDAQLAGAPARPARSEAEECARTSARDDAEEAVGEHAAGLSALAVRLAYETSPPVAPLVK